MNKKAIKKKNVHRARDGALEGMRGVLSWNLQDKEQ